MKHKKIIAILLLMCGFAGCLFACTEPERSNSEPSGPPAEPEKPEPEPETEPATARAPAEAPEIPQPPELPDDFVTSNITEIAHGIVFESGFRRGVNMGNMLEAPDEGAWGVYFEPLFFKLIKSRGFDFIRLPVGWHNNMATRGGVRVIGPMFMERVKYIVDEALKNDLGVIINIHHFNDMDSDPENNAETLYTIWRIISEQYQNYPANVVFEVFNEPHDKLNTKVWNLYQNECVKIIRETNPKRKIVVSAGDWGGIHGIMDLMLPEDENLILSYHYYDPFNFTHQGADWSNGPGGMDHALGTEWNNTDFERRAVDNAFKAVKAWSEAAGLPVLLGEFGSFSPADMASRARWTQCIRETAEYYGFAWSYWEFCSGFGIYDRESGEFFEELVHALTGTPVDEAAYASGCGLPKITVDRGLGFIGPFTVERNINIVCDSWTGMSLYDTENGTVVIELGGKSNVDWAQAYIILDGLADMGDGFSHDTVELTVRNIDGSITDFCINLDNGTTLETQLLWMNEGMLGSDTNEIVQNGDGTITFKMDLRRAYRTFRNKEDGPFRLKMFIESVPDRSGNYDREGKIEFIKVDLK